MYPAQASGRQLGREEWQIALACQPHALTGCGQAAATQASHGQTLPDKLLCMCVRDVFKPQASGICLASRVESVFVQRNEKVLVSPEAELATVRSILSEDAGSNCIFAGIHIQLMLAALDLLAILAEWWWGTPCRPCPWPRVSEPELWLSRRTICWSFQCKLHHARVQCGARVKKLVSTINKAMGEVTKNKPRCLAKGSNAIVEVSAEVPLYLELYANVLKLHKFMLRSNSKTVTAGVVTDIL